MMLASTIISLLLLYWNFKLDLLYPINHLLQPAGIVIAPLSCLTMDNIMILVIVITIIIILTIIIVIIRGI